MSLVIDPLMVGSVREYISCARKCHYISRKHAVNSGKSQTRKGAPPLKAYSCGVCGGWHLAKDRKAMR